MRGFSFEKVTEALKMTHNKTNLPEKICVNCNRPFTWRKNGREGKDQK